MRLRRALRHKVGQHRPDSPSPKRSFTGSERANHTFSATLNTGGSQTISANDPLKPRLYQRDPRHDHRERSEQHRHPCGVSATTSATAGLGFNVTVTAQDEINRTATGYSGHVHFTSTDGQASLPSDYTFTAADAGTHTFSVTLPTAGSQTISATDTANGSITGTSLGIVVGKRSQAITFTSQPPTNAVVGGPSYNVAATGGASTSPVIFSVDSTATSVCSISGATVSFTGVGSCVIDANQDGDANYNAAPQVQQTIAVKPAPLTITANNQTKQFGAPLPSLTATISGFVDGQSLSSSGVAGSASCSTTATSSSPGGMYPITCTQGSLTASNYAFTTFNPGTLTVAFAKTITGSYGGPLTVSPGQPVLLGPGLDHHRPGHDPAWRVA